MVQGKPPIYRVNREIDLKNLDLFLSRIHSYNFANKRTHSEIVLEFVSDGEVFYCGEVRTIDRLLPKVEEAVQSRLQGAG